MNKIIDKLLGYLPVSRKTYQRDMENLMIVIKGLQQTEIQHAQIEMNLLQNINALQAKKGKNNNEKSKDDIAFG